MWPTPSRQCLAPTLGSVLAMAAGVYWSSWPATLLGASIGVAIAACLAYTMAQDRRARKNGLEFGWKLRGDKGHIEGGAVIPGRAFDIQCFVQYRGRSTLELTDLAPLVHGGVDLDKRNLDLSVAGNQRTSFVLRLSARAAGRLVLHGLGAELRGPLGLFKTYFYFPNPLSVRVLPKAAGQLRTSARATLGSPLDRSGRARLSPANGGTDLRELRQLQPGDPFKSIAWKASARRGRLLVREVEQESQETVYFIMDVSGTMRGGLLGHRKLDFGVEAVAAESRRALDAGDKVGMVTIDGRVLAHVAPKDGRPQLLKIFNGLLASTDVVDEDLTDLDDDEVAEVVGRYLRHQDGVDFRHPKGRGWNIRLMLEHINKTSVELSMAANHIRASSPTGIILRRYCQQRAIPLPYRTEPRDGSKTAGLSRALRAAAARQRSPMSIHLITDLDGLDAPEELLKTISMLRIHRHSISVIVPDSASFLTEEKSTLIDTLKTVYARSESRRLQAFREAVTPLGVPVVGASAEESPGLAMARARAARRRAA